MGRGAKDVQDQGTRDGWRSGPPLQPNETTRIKPLPPEADAPDSELWLGRARQAVAERFGEQCARHGGMLVTCVGRFDKQVRFAERRMQRSLVVGRHQECDLQTNFTLGEVPLRHVLLWNAGTALAPRTRVFHLRGSLSTHVIGFGPVGSAVIDGPAVLWLGHTHLFVVHVVRGQRFLDAMPQRVPEVELAEYQRVVAGDTSGCRPIPKVNRADVSPAGGLLDLQHRRARPMGKVALELRLHGDNCRASHLTFTRAELERGVLLGRYARCDDGLRGQLPDSVSRVHLAILLHAGRPVAVDVASTNGVWLDGQDVPHCVLSRGRRVQLAEEVHLDVLHSEACRGEA